MVALVIRGGTIVDGTGAPAYRGDVAIDGRHIVQVGAVSEKGDREIDATGLLVTPGFVDIHTHFDGQATWDRVLAPSSWHGVTTIAMGNCGVGFAPARPQHREFLISLLEGVEDIPGTALSEGLDWRWESFPEYLDVLGEMHHTIDVSAHVPHAALRAYVMGERGADPDAEASPAEVKKMFEIVLEAVNAGAIGIATSRTVNHRTSQGELLGTLRADRAELLAFAEALKVADKGVIQLISDAFQTTDDRFADDELDLIEALAATSGRPVSFTVLQSPAAPTRWQHLLDRIDSMVAAGLNVRGQVASRPVGMLLGLEATANPFVPCPSYQEIAHLPARDRAAAMKDESRKRKILEEFEAYLAAENDGSPPDFYRRLANNYGLIFKLSDPVDYYLDANQSFEAVAKRNGQKPHAAIYDALLERDGSQLLYYPSQNFADRNFNALTSMVSESNVLFGLSDAGAHCGIISDASMPTSCLTMWGRDRPNGATLPLEQLVNGLTLRNALHMGWRDRGAVRAGLLADLNLIDFDQLECEHPMIAHDLPAGGHRLLQKAHGYRATIKSGVVTFENGEHTGEFPGRLVRGSTSA